MCYNMSSVSASVVDVVVVYDDGDDDDVIVDEAGDDPRHERHLKLVTDCP